jgi:outer membrane protein OmpA-like peptidoglycan-associated protein
MLPEQVQRLAKGVHDMALVDVVGVSVVGHTCDIGGPVKNARVGTKRAAAAAATLRGLGRLPKGIEPQLVYRQNESERPVAANAEEEEKERRKLRRIEVIITYRLREDQ